MKNLIGDDHLAKAARNEYRNPYRNVDEEADDAAVVIDKRQAGKASQQEANTAPNGDNINAAIQNFEKYGKQYFKKKFQNQLADQFREAENMPKDHFAAPGDDEASESMTEDLTS